MEPIQQGKYKLIENLGGGGFGTVYKAEDPIGRTVAVKVLKPGWSDDLEVLDRFRREALAAGSLFHPHIATILDMDEVEGRRFIVMRYVEGKSLDRILKEDGPLSWDQVMEITLQIADALTFAHTKGFIHRDVKPANILISEEEGAVLTDFGLVRAATSSGLSSSDSVVGTPNYIAPEIWHGKPPASAASDEYSLACVVYEMVTGKVLFQGTSAPEIMTKHVLERPEFPKEWPESVPEGFTQVLEKALEKSPGDRYLDSEMFVSALEKLDTQGDEEQTKQAELDRQNKEEQAWQAVAEMKRLLEQAKQVEADRQQKEEQARQKKLKAEQQRKENLKRIGTFVAGLALVGLVVWSVSQFVDRGPGTQTAKPVTTEAQVNHIKEAKAGEESVAEVFYNGDTRVRPGDQMEMVYVPAGDFVMGSEDGDSDESPKHTVYLNTYWIDKYEVTNGQYAAFLNEMGNQNEGGRTLLDSLDEDVRIHLKSGEWRPDDGYADHPVVEVSWYGSRAYCEWAGGRLPTEAEWEKAARGTDGGTYPWGEESPNADLLNYNQNIGDTTTVGSYPDGASPYGALDMAGNVWEWTSSLDQDYPYDPQDGREAPDASGSRVLRGGSWDFDETLIRAVGRHGGYPDSMNGNVGFRCVVSAAIP